MSNMIVFKGLDDMPPLAVSLGTMRWSSTGSWRHVRPCYENHIPPCTQGCPAGEKIPQYFDFVKRGKHEAAWCTILEDNPLPGVCGRVCYHPCEQVCNRQYFDEPIAVHCMERFVADMNMDNHTPMPLLEDKKNVRVAVIGSGPAGLSCAYHLARLGYQVTIFESHPEPGGMLRVGIPKFRLPREVLDKEIADIQRLGVDIITHTTFGRDLHWKDLGEFKALFIATGAHESKSMKVPGEDARGVMSGLQFLSRLNLGGHPEIGKKVAVIGGGNTAIDAARSALRLGSEPTIVYRRSRAEMPAVPDEVDEAEKEGVKFIFLATPVNIISENNRIVRMECVKMRLGEPDASGRRKPVPIENSNFTMDVETILAAIGEDPKVEFTAEFIDRENGHIKVDESQLTNREGTFAGGDVASNPLGTVVDAVHAGKNAAMSIHQYLGGKVPRPSSELIQSLALGHVPNLVSGLKVIAYEDILTHYFQTGKRPTIERIPIDESISSFKEVNKALSENVATDEANRCFSCGVCTHCDNCLIFCPDVSILRKDTEGYDIDYDHCKGCGICVEECPREAMAIEEELKWRL